MEYEDNADNFKACNKKPTLPPPNQVKNPEERVKRYLVVK